MKKAMFLLFILATVTGAGAVYWRWSSGPDISFRTLPVKRSDLVVTISATGTVEPEEVVDVGAQVAGKIEVFGKDASGKTVDYGTSVEQGMILAHIDDALYAADVEQAAAQLDQAKANVEKARADLDQTRVKVVQAERNWKRAQELGPSRALSATDFDSYLAAYETAKATVAVAEATVVQAERGVAYSEAALKRSKTNLSYCTIRSPVNGVIIDRRVNIGQTVVASLNAPSLFLIAKDLKKMQVWASVNEADVGSIYTGQPVTFTVDAHPGQTFVGVVGKIRLNASMVQNVVNYTVEVNTDNSSGTLLPYLTANVQFEVARRDDVLLVPESALRWKPSSPEIVAPEAREEYAKQIESKNNRRRSAAAGPPKNGDETHGVVWIEENNLVRPVTVKLGQSDGSLTEMESDSVKEETSVVVSEFATAAAEQTTNPFAPQLFGRGGRR